MVQLASIKIKKLDLQKKGANNKWCTSISSSQNEAPCFSNGVEKALKVGHCSEAPCFSNGVEKTLKVGHCKAQCTQWANMKVLRAKNINCP